MTRISKGLFLLLGITGLTLLSSSCSQGQLSGSNALNGGKTKDKDKKNNEDDSDDDAKDQPEETEEGTDVPIWVNASYLTCVTENDKSDATNVSVLCGLDDAEGKAIKPDGTKVEWVALTSDGDKADDKTEAADTGDRMQHRFFFAGKTLAKRAVGAQFNGHDLSAGKKVGMTDALKKVDEDADLFACLEAADSVAKDCVPEKEATLGLPGGLIAIRAFVLSSTSNGKLGGIGGADDACQMGAISGGLTGNFRALLSTDSQDAVDRVPAGLKIVDAASGDTIALDSSALFKGSLEIPLARNEHGQTVVNAGVWTGSTAAGKTTGENCDNWTNSGSGDLGGVGRVGAPGSEWISAKSLGGGFSPCATQEHLYCVEFDK